MNLLIFLNLMQKFQILHSSGAKYPNFFLIFICNPGKLFLILPIIRRADVYLISNWSWPTTLGRCGRKAPSYLCFKDYNDRLLIQKLSRQGVYGTLIFLSAGSILSNLSDITVPKIGVHREDCEERTKRESLKNNDDPMHPHRVIVNFMKNANVSTFWNFDVQ